MREMTPRSEWPEWLKEASTTNAQVEIVDGRVVWHRGKWHGGMWLDGTWLGGEWLDGIWSGGTWHTGVWRDGVWFGGTWLDGMWEEGKWLDGEWHGGTWYGGVWHGGVWRGGVWRGGTWHGGKWRDPQISDRLTFHASAAGVVFEGGKASAYRVVGGGLNGLWDHSFIQPLNQQVEVYAAPRGAGTCRAGLHATSATRAYTFFRPEPTNRLIKITFTRDQLLDADGEKVRLSGGYCEEVPWPWNEKENIDA